MKKIIAFFSAIMTCLILSISLSSSSVTSSVVSQSIFEKHPPIPTNFWVRKVRNPKSKKMIIRVKYIHDDHLPQEINLYQGTSIGLHLRDDGNFPDITRADGIYASLIDQDPTEFVNLYNSNYKQVSSKGYALSFNGHLGERIPGAEFRPLNTVTFDSFQDVEINPVLLNEFDCSQSIKKQNSLLITDLSVVEDPARTNNILSSSIGNKEGAWTMGQLFKNMAGGLPEDPSTSEIRVVTDFIKGWLKNLSGGYTHNGIASENMRDPFKVYQVIIAPWIMRAKGETSYNSSISSYTEFDDGEPIENYWENVWDEFDTEEELIDLLGAAPFKLTAIVNRMDLRHNAAYTSRISKSGETRFVFSLIAAYGNDVFNNGGWAGQPPYHFNIDPANELKIDWEGMNVIFEYGNVETDKCDMRQRARDWVELSLYDMNDPVDLAIYLEKLQVLTDVVTAVGAAPTKPNGSAISQIQTNEKMFGELVGADDEDSATTQWEEIDWELRVYKIDANGMLSHSPANNVPLASNNYNTNTRAISPTDWPGNTEILDWIYGVSGPLNMTKVQFGNHDLPSHLIMGTAEVQDEWVSYYGLNFADAPDYIYNEDDYGVFAYRDKEIRKQLSLQSCGGCHTSETKTLFTMIRPLGYGEEAIYWGDAANMSTTTGDIDVRFYNYGEGTEDIDYSEFSNYGYTWDEYTQTTIDTQKPYYYMDYESEIDADDIEHIELVSGNRVVPNVSAFLTGRNIRSDYGYEDDLYTNSLSSDNQISFGPNDDGDDDLGGLFYVNDPSNDSDSNGDGVFPGHHNKQHGFNDLQRRKDDLCRLISRPCSGNTFQVIDVVLGTTMVPIPE